MNFVDIVFASLLANHLLFFHYFGLGELLIEDRPLPIARRTFALTGLLFVAAALWWVPDQYVLVAYHLEFLRTLLLFAVLALVSALWSFVSPTLPGAWPPAREFLVHSFLVGAVILVGSSSAHLGEVLTAAVAVSLGYGAALVLLGAVHHRLSREAVPSFMQGLPLQLLTLGLVWLILQGLGFAFAGNAS